MNTKVKTPRLLYLDNIKVLFAILVIFQHARVTYDGQGWWYYIESAPQDTFSTIIFLIVTSIGGLFQASLMGLFFLMGGYFTPRSYDRKGPALFWKERLVRLGIPLLLYVVLINPLIFFIMATLGIPPWSIDPALQGSFLEAYLSHFQSFAHFVDFLTNAGPMWFLYVLLIFTAIYTLWRQMTKGKVFQQYAPEDFPIPNYFLLLLFAIILGCVTFVMRLFVPIDDSYLGIPFGFMAQYLMMFCVGVIGLRFGWFEKINRGQIKAWAITIVITFFLFYLYGFFALGLDADFSVMLGGPTLHALAFALADNIICVGMIFVLIPLFQRRFNRQGILLHNLSTSAYHIYLIHPPVLILVALLFAPLPFIPVVKLAFVFPITVILCYLASHYGWQRIRWRRSGTVSPKGVDKGTARN